MNATAAALLRIWAGLNGGKVPQLRQIQMEGWHSSLDSICIDSRVSSIRRRGVVAVREKKSGVQVAPTKSVGRVLVAS